MARLTLSEQLAASETTIASLRAMLSEAQQKAIINDAEITRLRESLQKAEERGALVTALTTELEETKKKLATSEQSKTYNAERANKAESELEQAHAVLDGVTGAPARTYEQEYGKGNRNVVTRLAGAFLAIAQNGSVA